MDRATQHYHRINVSQAGFAYLEYALSTLVLLILLFAPLPGLDQSIVDIVMESIRDFNRNSSYLLSIP